MMFNRLVFRPVTQQDLDGLEMLAIQANVGLSTLPKDRELLAQKIEHSVLDWQNSKLVVKTK